MTTTITERVIEQAEQIPKRKANYDERRINNGNDYDDVIDYSTSQ